MPLRAAVSQVPNFQISMNSKQNRRYRSSDLSAVENFPIYSRKDAKALNFKARLSRIVAWQIDGTRFAVKSRQIL